MKLSVIEKLVKEIYGESFEDLEELQVDEFDSGKLFEISFRSEDFEQMYLLDLKNNISYNGSIEVFSEGEGFGRKLVEAREELCHALEINEIIINNNMNGSFWSYMGYERASDEQVEYWSGNYEIDSFDDCMFKSL